MRKFLFSALVVAALTSTASYGQAQQMGANQALQGVFGPVTPTGGGYYTSTPPAVYYQGYAYNGMPVTPTGGGYNSSTPPSVYYNGYPSNWLPYAYGPHLSYWYGPQWYRTWYGGHHGWSGNGRQDYGWQNRMPAPVQASGYSGQYYPRQ